MAKQMDRLKEKLKRRQTNIHTKVLKAKNVLQTKLAKMSIAQM